MALSMKARERRWAADQKYRTERAEYERGKQRLRPRASWERRNTLPRWVWAMLHRAHLDAAVYQLGALHVLFNDCRHGCLEARRFMDHVMISQDGALVFEPYATIEDAQRQAQSYALTHGLKYTVSPIAWHHIGCVRVEFRPRA